MIFENRVKHWQLYLCIPCIIGCFIHCSGRQVDKDLETLANDYQEVKITRIKFNFDQLFEIKEIKKGRSISDLHVKGIGFQKSTHILKFESVSPLESFLLGDIDSDGFEELYLITRSVGSGSQAKIIGITSNKGKSYKSIYIPEYDPTLNITHDYLNGYMGHDSIYLSGNQLCREFPVYKKGDSHALPTGGVRKVFYKLIEFENSFSLQQLPNLTVN